MDSLEVEDIIRFLLYPTVNYERERVNTILEITKEKHEVRYRTVRYRTVQYDAFYNFDIKKSLY